MITVDELWLKGKNQPFYVKVLKNHIEYILKKYQIEYNMADVKLYRKMERFFILLHRLIELSTLENLLKELSYIPGISYIIPCVKIDLNSSIDFIGSHILDLLDYEQENELIEKFSLETKNTSAKESLAKSRNKNKALDNSQAYSFAVKTKRVHKQFPLKSVELNQQIGGVILEKYPHLKVNLTSPQLSIHIRILRDGLYLYNRFLLGQGGLPIGTSGRAVTLISGGFDSPVASYLMAKRGVAQDFLFFFAKDKVQKEVKDKILNLSKILARFQVKSSLYIVNSIEIQKVIKESSDEAYRTLLLRHFMQKTAEKLSEKTNAVAIITGDSLGQVASQTIHNLSALETSSNLPVLRPLIGYNKKDIISLSRIIETHDISVLPHDDACAMFAPKHPILQPDVNYWNKYISENIFDEVIEKSLEEAEVIVLN